MAFGFLARPFKDINKAVKKVGGGVTRAAKSVAGGANKVGRVAAGAAKGAVAGGKAAGPSNKLKKKMMPGMD